MKAGSFRLHPCLAIGLLIGAIFAANAADEVLVITSISPDGRYALRTYSKADETKSEVILLPKGDADVEWGTVMELERDYEHPVEHLYWSPDSKRFAFSYPETQRFTAIAVFARTGDSFEKVELPEIPQEYPHRGAGWSFRAKGDSVTPLRWPDSQTLLVKTWAYGYLNNRKTGEAEGGSANGLARLRFAKGKCTVEPMPPPSSNFRGLDKDERLRDVMEHRDTLEIQWLPDKSAALLVRRYDEENEVAVRLVELRKGRVTRITDLRKLLDDLLTADYRDHPVKGAKSVPALRHRFEDWWLVGSDRVAVECQATAEFSDPADAEADWGARFDGEWSIKEARWLRRETKRFSFGDK